MFLNEFTKRAIYVDVKNFVIKILSYTFKILYLKKFFFNSFNYVLLRAIQLALLADMRKQTS